MWTRALGLLLLIHLCGSVTVKVGDLTFTLDSVKTFKEIKDGSHTVELRSGGNDYKSYVKICKNEDLPDEIKAVCDIEDVSLVEETFKGLDSVTDHVDVCEVCAFAACTGC
ncbi:guanylin-like [Mixophyes fleayi]|uniref:guanylin-like n=1 Tax=Mixophyes fleayi TaxID=3061075 RepID=UPI003F4E1F97